MELRNRVLEAVGEIGRTSVSLSAFERQLSVSSDAWLTALTQRIKQRPSASDTSVLKSELASVVDVLLKATASPQINTILGNALSLMLEMDRAGNSTALVMRRLLGDPLAEEARVGNLRFLLLNPGTGSTRISLYQGLEEIHQSEIHLSPDDEDSMEYRARMVAGHLESMGTRLSSLDGIACQGGFLQLIPSGTYQVVPEMVRDLTARPLRSHASNLGIAMGLKLAEMAGSQSDMLLTTTDPFVCDELDVVDRMTGFVRIKRDGAGGHYLSHKAAWRLLASLMNTAPEYLDTVTVHAGGGTSLAAHRNGRVSMLIDAYSGLPSTSRSGSIDIDRVIKSIKANEFSVKDLERVMT